MINCDELKYQLLDQVAIEHIYDGFDALGLPNPLYALRFPLYLI